MSRRAAARWLQEPLVRLGVLDPGASLLDGSVIIVGVWFYAIAACLAGLVLTHLAAGVLALWGRR